jgi:hypothetical protein
MEWSDCGVGGTAARRRDGGDEGKDRGGRWVSSLVVQASRAGPDWVPGLGLVSSKPWTLFSVSSWSR